MTTPATMAPVDFFFGASPTAATDEVVDEMPRSCVAVTFVSIDDAVGVIVVVVAVVVTVATSGTSANAITDGAQSRTTTASLQQSNIRLVRNDYLKTILYLLGAADSCAQHRCIHPHLFRTQTEKNCNSIKIIVSIKRKHT